MRFPQLVRDRRVLAIDWDPESIRIIHAVSSRKGPKRIHGVLVPVAEGVDVEDPESLGQFIARALKQRKLRTRQAIVAIPRDQAVLHMLSLPNVPPEEMPSVVHFQITKELPFALEEARIDFASFPADEGAETVDVLVAAVRNDVLEHYQAVCEAAGLELQRVGLRPFANTVAVTWGESEITQGCTLLVDVGPSLTEIDLIRGGHLSFSRAASVNVPTMPAVRTMSDMGEGPLPLTIAPTEAEKREALDNLLVEVNRTIEAYRVSDPAASIESIVVAGSCGVEEQLCEEVADRFGAPARLYNPSEAVPALGGRGEEMTAFSSSLGLTIGHGREGALHFDFLHPKEPVDLSAMKARKVPVIAATVIVLIAALMVFRYQVDSVKSAEVRTVQKKASKLKKQAGKVTDFRDIVTAAEDWADEEVVWLDQLALISHLFPPTNEAYVTKLFAKDNGTIQMSVRATRMTRLEELRKGFERMGPYEAILGTVKKVSDKQGFTSESDIVLRLKPKEELEADKKAAEALMRRTKPATARPKPRAKAAIPKPNKRPSRKR